MNFSRYPKNVIIVGAGGIGFYLSPMITRMVNDSSGKTNIVIIDGDSIEQKNLARAFGADQVGQNKAYVLRDQLLRMAPYPDNLNITALGLYFDDSRECAGAIQEATDPGQTALFGCVDNAQTRIMLQNFAEKKSESCVISYLDGGNDLTSGQSFLYVGMPGGASPRIDQVFPDLAAAEGIQDLHPNNVPCTAVYESEPQQALTNSMVANLMCGHFFSLTNLDLEEVRNVVRCDLKDQDRLAVANSLAPRETVSQEEFKNIDAPVVGV
jgi:molybdopterin/thiamine biosynthesis adenylyltransferase